jgi:prepilin-type N-terminal cleavage/methylation domain-containing protein/prepilin-type processing-associated H-X9-DG protein
MKKSAFTLIELLVVIAIIATLASLALPVILKINEKGRATDDAHRLHQLGIATSAYLADNNEQIFSTITPGGWPSVLYSKYAQNWKVYKSPFDTRPDGAAVSTGAGVPVSYGINANILTQSTSAGSGFDGNATKYSSPTQLIYMAPNVDLSQSTLTFVRGTGDTNVMLNVPTTTPATNSDNRGTHASRGQINVLFADFHAVSISYRDFATTTSADGSGQARWQPIRTP